MIGYVLSADADLDLDEIWEYIAGDDIDAADRWTGKLFDALERWREIRHDFLIYRAERRPIEILAVTQGSRDIPAFLKRHVSH